MIQVSDAQGPPEPVELTVRSTHQPTGRLSDTEHPYVRLLHRHRQCCQRMAARLHAVGDFMRARRAAERVIELRQDDRARSRAFAFLSLAQTLLCQPRPELLEACALARRVAGHSASIASARISQQLREVRLLLEPHRPIPEIGDFLEESQHGA
jgi:hypothetical protein